MNNLVSLTLAALLLALHAAGASTKKQR